MIRLAPGGAVRIFAAILIAGLFLRCAHVEPPPGGPVDAQPPYVSAVFPAPGALNVPRQSVLTLKFSEWIDRGAGRGSVVLSPPMPGKIKVEVDGDRLLIHLPKGSSGGLSANTTYRLTVLGTLKDLHGISLGRPFSYAFTTGESFDSGSVSGKAELFDRKGTVLAALYRVSARDNGSVQPRLVAEVAGFKPDSLPSPARELPAVVVTVDSTGAFALDSVAQGDYALFAFEDLNGNLAPDFGFERMAVGSSEIHLSPRASRQTLHLAALDTGLQNAGRKFVTGFPAPDTTVWTFSFLAPPNAVGLIAPLAGDPAPASEYHLRSSRILTEDRWNILKDKLMVRVDTLPVKVELQHLDSVRLSIRLPQSLRPGQGLRLQLPPHAELAGKDSSDTLVRTMLSAKALDSLRLGGLRFTVPAGWKGWTFLLQTPSSASERILPPGVSEPVFLSPLATGRYRLAAFEDRNGDGIWNPGSIRPWIPQEPYATLLDSLEVAPGPVADVTGRLPESPR